MTKKRITVEMTLSWTFDEKDWSEEKEHIETLRNNPQIIIGNDVHNSWHCLNEMTYPNLINIKVTDAND